LLAAILADGANLGLSGMADASRGLNYHRLVNVAEAYAPKVTQMLFRCIPTSGSRGDGCGQRVDGSTQGGHQRQAHRSEARAPRK